MKKYKLIILIIASNGGVYDIFTEYWNKYMNTHPDIKSFFIYGQSSANTSNVDHFFNSFNSLYKDVSIISPTVESCIPGSLQKTIYSFEYIEKNFEYEYIMRTNLSSFFDINQLMVFINTLPKERLYCGKNNRNYISGSCFILSKDVVKLIIQNKDRIDYNIIDDVSIGKLLRNLNIKLINNMSYEVHNTNTTMNIVSINNTPNFFNYYRLRSLNYIRYNQNANNYTKTNGNGTIRVFKSIYTKNNNSNQQENTFTQSTTKVNNFVNKNTVVNNNINQIKQPIKLTISKIVSNVIRKSTLSIIQSSKINNNRNNNSNTNLNNQNTNNKKSKTSQKRISRISYIAPNQTKAINIIRVKSIK